MLTQGDLDTALLEATHRTWNTGTVASLVERADTKGLRVPGQVREHLAREQGMDHYADFWYGAVGTLVEAHAIPVGGLEEWVRDHFSMVVKKYADGAGFTPRDIAAFAQTGDYAGKLDTAPIRTERHIQEAEKLLPYFADPDTVKRGIARIRESRALLQRHRPAR